MPLGAQPGHAAPGTGFAERPRGQTQGVDHRELVQGKRWRLLLLPDNRITGFLPEGATGDVAHYRASRLAARGEEPLRPLGG